MCVMNKEYLLLRNNNVLGPFSIDELLQQHLKSTDMIWMEGRSVAWCYPSQIKELNTDFQRILSSVDKQAGNNLVPSHPTEHLPELSFEERVEAIRKKALAYSYQEPIKKPIAEEKFSSPYIKKEPVNLVYHTSKRYVTLAQLIASGAVTAIVAWVWYSGWSPVNPRVASEEAAVSPVNIVSIQENAAKIKIAEDTAGTIGYLTDSIQAKPLVSFTSRKQVAIADTGFNSEDAADIVDVASNAATETSVASAEEVKKESSADEVDKSVEKIEIKEDDKVTTSEPEKKKTLGQAIKGIFKKKKKDKNDNRSEE